MIGKVSAKAVIVNSDGKFLVLTNSYLDSKPEIAYAPDFPGGTVEKGESIEDALIREVKEELGIDIASAPCEQIATCGSKLFGFTAVMHLIWANVHDVNLDQEHCMFSWLTLDEMRRLPWWGGYRHLFEQIEERLASVSGAEFAEFKQAFTYV